MKLLLRFLVGLLLGGGLLFTYAQEGFEFISKEQAHAVLAQPKAPVDSQIVATLSLSMGWAQSKPDSGLFWVQQAEQLIKRQGQRSYRPHANYCHGIALYYDRSNRKPEAIPYFKTAGKQFEEAREYVGAINSYRALGKAYQILGQVDSTEACYLKALTLTRQHGQPQDRLTIYDLLIEFYHLAKGDIDQAREYADSLNEYLYLEVVKDPVARAFAHSRLGSLYQEISKLPLAIKHYAQAKELLAPLDRPVQKFTAFFNQGICYGKADFVDSALVNFLASLEIAEQIGYAKHYPLIKLELAGLYARAKNSALAEKYLQEALEAASPAEAVHYRQFVFTGMARAVEHSEEKMFDTFDSLATEQVSTLSEAYLLLYDFFRAAALFAFEDNFRAALAAFQEIEQTPAEVPRTFSKPYLWWMMGECHLALGRPEEALKMVDRFMDLPTEAKEKGGSLEDILSLRTHAYQRLGEVEKARESWEEYQAAVQKKMDTKFAIAVQIGETRYQTNKIKAERDLQAKERELAEQQAQQNLQIAGTTGGGLLLTSVLALFLYRSRQEQRRLVSLNENLLTELNHRTANNIQQVAYLLELQSKQVSQAEAKDSLQEGNQRVQTLSFLHKTLLGNKYAGEINLRDYLNELVHNLLNAYGFKPHEIDLHLNLADLDLSVDKGMPVGLIVNEWVTNAIKYALRGSSAPYLAVSLQLLDAHTAELVVADHGPGLPPELDLKTTDSYGLGLVYKMAEQLWGKVSVEQHGGTRWRFVFRHR